MDSEYLFTLETSDDIRRLIELGPLPEAEDLEKTRLSLNEYARLLGVEAVRLSRFDIQEQGRQRIAALLRSEDPKIGINADDFRAMISQVVIEQFLAPGDCEELMSILSTLRDLSKEQAFSPPIDPPTTNWLESIRILRILAMGDGLYSSDYLENVYSSERNLAHCLKALSQHGFSYTLKGGKVTIDSHERERIADKIDTGIRAYGGRRFLSHLISGLETLYDPDLRRFIFSRFCGSPHHGLIPAGYLYSLSLKHLDANPEAPEPSPCFGQILELSSAWFGSEALVSFSNMDMLFYRVSTLSNFLRRVLLFDSIYRIPNEDPAHAFTLLELLKDAFTEEEQELALGHSADAHLQVQKRLLDSFQGGGVDTIAPKALSQILDCLAPRHESLDTSLSSFAQSYTGVNQGFRLPEDLQDEAFTQWRKPYVVLPEGELFCPHPSVNAYAIYGAPLMNFLSTFTSQVATDRIGLAFEEYLKTKLKSRNIRFVAGKFKTDAREGQVDCLIETESSVIVMEAKNKPLTRRSRAGDIVKGLEDFVVAIVRSQAQCLNTELALRENSTLMLQCGDDEQPVSLNGRSVERVTLSLPDWGSLHDRAIFQELLRILLFTEFTATDGDHRRTVDKLNKELDDFRQKVNDWAVKTGIKNPHKIFFPCWFLSSGHLSVLAEGCDGAEALWQQMLRVRHVTTGSADFYREWSHFKNLPVARKHPAQSFSDIHVHNSSEE